MKNYILTCVLSFICVCGMAHEKKLIDGFSGGMMLHSGYQSGGDNPYGYNPKGATFGIGGVARLHLSDHFRAGFEGYFSTLGLKEDLAKGSHNKLFWTGVLADFFLEGRTFLSIYRCYIRWRYGNIILYV